ncbi:MAG: M12 family metallo-peptidase, partial [Archangium sp.]
AVTAAPVKSELPQQPPRVYLVSALVDLDYQAQVQHWNERINLQLTRVSEVTKAALNVELKLVSIDSWDRHSTRGSLEEHLEALQRDDDARDVDLVIGFVASLQAFTESQEQLGRALVPGHYAVVRALDDASEQDAINKVFTRLDSKERDALYRERKLHKEYTVILHEWAHALGAPHDTAPSSLVNPQYSIHRSGFQPAMLAFLAKSLALRDAKLERKAWAAGLPDALKAQPEGWEPNEYKTALEDLERVVSGEKKPGVKVALSVEDKRTWDAAVRLSQQNKRDEALATLKPLVARAPENGDVQPMGCQLAGMVNLALPETRMYCEKALALEPSSGVAQLFLAQLENNAKRVPEARKYFVDAREKLLPKATVETHAVLGTVARSLGYLTWAESSSARAFGRVSADAVVEYIAKRRRWMGLPAGVASPAPQDEPAYVDRYTAVQDAFDDRQFAKAEGGIAELERDFPSLAGPLTLRCELMLRKGQNAKATSSCEKALTLWSDSTHARYLLGVMASMAGQHKKAIEHLEEVLVVDSSVDDAWQRLATAYKALGDTVNLKRVQSRQLRA